MKRILLVLFLCSNCFGAAVAQWKLNDDADNATVADSVGSYTGTFVGTGGADDYTSAHTTTGHINAAFDFDGTNDYIDLNTNFGFSKTSTFTILVWFKADTLVPANQIIFGRNGNGKLFQIGVRDDLDVRVAWGASSVKAVDSANTLVINTWYHVAFTFNAGSAVLYLDAVSVDTEAVASDGFADSTEIHIGNRGGDNSSPFNGIIDNVVIYNTVLTQKEIASLYNAGTGTEDANLISNLRVRYSDGYRYKYRNRYN